MADRTQMAFRLSSDKRQALKIALAVRNVSLQTLCESAVDMIIDYDNLKGARKTVMNAIIKQSKEQAKE